MAKRSRGVVPLADGLAGRRRPPAVTLVAVLYIVQGSLPFLVTLPVYARRLRPAPGDDATPLTGEQGVVLVAATCICVGLLASAYGLLRLHRWGWTAAMTTQCIVLTISLVTYLSGEPSYLFMLLGALSVLLLNQRDVRLTFEGSVGDGG